MYQNSLLTCLKELRDVKFTLASRAFKHYYETWRLGRDEESAIIRSGALKELQELFALEEWITTLGGRSKRDRAQSGRGLDGRRPIPHAVTAESSGSARIQKTRSRTTKP